MQSYLKNIKNSDIFQVISSQEKKFQQFQEKYAN